jgi:protoporphyrinogen oxidase
VLRGALGRKPRALGYNQRFFYPKAGIGELARRLTQQLIHVELNRAPLSINYATRQLTFRDQTLSYQHLISSIPLNRLLTLCGALPSEVEQAKHKLRCTHLYYLDVALSETCGKPFHWVYVPEARYPFYRVGCYSNFSAQMAPRGSAGLYVELAARSEPDLNKLLPQVAAGLVEMGMISSPGAIRFARVRRIEHAYVIFDQDYAAATTAAHAFLSEHGITSTGRYGEWTYSSMTDALSCGRSAVRAIACTK